MIILGALVDFATGLEVTLGPILSEILGFIGIAALGWWRARKMIKGVEERAEAGIKVANDRASTAKAEARAVTVQLAELKGSMRPASYTPSTGTSVTMPELPEGIPKPRASMLDPSLSGEEPLPRPSGLPSFLRDTPAERPSSKVER